MDIHQVGARYSWGIPQANRTHITDISDLLWERGYVPNIDGGDQLRIVVTKTYRPKWLSFVVTVTEASGDTLAEYRRTVPLPIDAPGEQIAAYKLLAYSIFQDNLLRAMFGLNDAINLNQELNNFFDLVFGSKHERHKRQGQLIKLAVASDDIRPIPPNRHFDEYFKEIGSGAQRHGDTTSVCGLELAYKRFGSLSEGLDFDVIQSSKQIFPVMLKASLNTNQVLDYYCSEDSNDFWIISWHSDVGWPIKFGRYAKEGTLKGVTYFQMPVPLNHKSVINKGSLKLSRNGVDGFAVSTPVVLAEPSNKDFSQSTYRVLQFEKSGTQK